MKVAIVTKVKRVAIVTIVVAAFAATFVAGFWAGRQKYNQIMIAGQECYESDGMDCYVLNWQIEQDLRAYYEEK